MKLIPLTQGKFAMVDDEDYEFLSQFKWCAQKGGLTWYAVRRIALSVGVYKNITMHQFMTGLDGVDHRNNCGLDNQRGNLRPCTHSNNLRNKVKTKSATSSRYKGVSWHKGARKWSAGINPEPRTNRLHLGLFVEEIAAAKAYDDAARKYFGEFACTNFPSNADSSAIARA